MTNGPLAKLTLNQKVAIFPRGQFHKLVGDGGCYALVDEALRWAGAKSGDSYPDNLDARGKIKGEADYVWGAPIRDLKDVQPRDILQFRDHKITIKTTTKITKKLPGNKIFKDTQAVDQCHRRPHHSAIVAENLGNGVLKIFEQNVKPLGRKVQSHKIYTRSIPPRTDGSKTTTITVEGTIWAYRPA